MDQVRRINASLRIRILFENDFFLIMPQVPGIVVMCHPLTVVAEKFVEALMIGISGGTGISKAPFPEGAGGIAGLFKKAGKRDRSLRQG